MSAVFLDWDTMGPGLDISKLQALLPDLQVFGNTKKNKVAERIGRAEVVLCNKVRLSRQVFEACPDMHFAGLMATGTDNVDLDAARDHGVTVANIRDYCTQSVVEHVFGCILNFAHNLGNYSSDVRKGTWQFADNFCLITHPITELSSMTLGIVGFGALGKGVANMAEAFDMEVLVAARPGTNGVPRGRVPLGEILERCDVISLHCPLTEDTRELFSTAEFGAMKKSALLVNTARGGLVDSQALVDALHDGEIAAAVIDVLPEEPPVNGNPLLDYEGSNLMVTPHIAWATLQARQNAIDEQTANIAAFRCGKNRNRVV
jgi:glycerate dehydrogenase